MGDEKLLKEIGARINDHRKELRLTQEQLAERMEVSLQMISNLELGKKAIRPENLVKLCAALGVSADYILCGKRSDFEHSELCRKISLLSVEKQQIIESLVAALLDN